MGISKSNLKKQLEKLGIVVKGGYVRKQDISKLIIKGDAEQKTVYYRAKKFTPIDTENPTITQDKFRNKPSSGWFETKEEAISNYREAQVIAEKRADEIKKELDRLQKKLGFYISYTMEGDTYGIHTDYQYICIKVDEYEFTLKIED